MLAGQPFKVRGGDAACFDVLFALQGLASFLVSPPSFFVAASSSLRTPPCPLSLKIIAFWSRSLVEQVRLDALVSRGLLHERTYRLPGPEDIPEPSAGFLVSFVHFHECGFVMPPHRILVGLLHHYKI